MNEELEVILSEVYKDMTVGELVENACAILDEVDDLSKADEFIDNITQQLVETEMSLAERVYVCSMLSAAFAMQGAIEFEMSLPAFEASEILRGDE